MAPKKPKVTSSADRSKRAARSKATVSGKTPSSRANRSAVSTAKVTSNTTKPASAQATDARKFQALNQSASVKAGKAAEPKPRTAAPGTGNVLKTAQQFSKDKAAQQRNVNRGVAAFRSSVNQSTVGKAAAALGGLRGGAVQAIADTVAPRPTAKGTLKGGGAVGPSVPKRLEQQGYAAQERKARQKLAARKSSTKSSSATPNTAASFDSAFKDARRAKVKSFTWRGKKYTTKKAGE